MHYRTLGNTGLTVSEVGFGCNRLGEENQPDQHWVDVVHRATDLGVTVFDTSESYGWGRSEEMLGLAIGERDDVLVATKISRIRETGGKDFSSKRMLENAEQSLKRLRRSRIDIYQLHSPSREALDTFDWAEGMERLKQQGKIRFAAVAVNSAADGLWLIEHGGIQILQITYNIFNTEAEKALFDRAEREGIGMLCRLPLAQGILTGKFRPDESVPEGHRAHLAGEKMMRRIEKAEQLRPLGETYEGGMTRMAHHFSLAPRAVSAIIPGARTIAQLEENVAASNGTGLAQGIRKEIDRIRSRWDESEGWF